MSAAANPIICYSVKTNGNIHIGKLMAEHGSGFDVTSGGELYRALQAGATGIVSSQPAACLDEGHMNEHGAAEVGNGYKVKSRSIVLLEGP